MLIRHLKIAVADIMQWALKDVKMYSAVDFYATPKLYLYESKGIFSGDVGQQILSTQLSLD